MRLDHIEEGRSHRSLRWIGLGLWLALLAGSGLLAHANGRTTSVLPLLLTGALATVGVVGLVAFARMTSAPPELRTLRVLAILLPTLFVVCMEAILLVVEADDLFTELGEHILATAVLSLSAIPFSIWVFGVFSVQRDELTRHADRLATLHRASLAVTGEATSRAVREAIVQGARAVVLADRATLFAPALGGGAAVLVSDPPTPQAGDRELELLREAGTLATTTVDASARAYLSARAQGAAGPALLAERDAGPAFGDEEALVLDMFAVAAAAGIENAARLEDAQLHATVEERERIARDLHDDLGQLLGFLTAKIQATQELVATGNADRAASELAGLERATRTLSAQVRESILGLRTSLGPEQPLGRALEDYTAEFGIQAGLRTSFDGHPDAGEALPSSTRYQVLRIAQEAMSNARRHASATSVDVSLREIDGILELTVVDDGTGFASDGATGNGGPTGGAGRFGLKTMAERARAAGGSLQVSTAPGQGTTVRATVPASPGEGS